MKQPVFAITVTRQSNGLLLSTIYKNDYYKKLYVGYSQREAKKMFRQYVKDQLALIFIEQK